jgi:hypothetical protein
MAGKKLSPKYHIGVFANMREIYLRKNKPGIYKRLRDSGELEQHLKAFQAHHALIAEEKHQELAKERGVNHQLLRMNYIEWVAKTVEIQEEVREYMVKLICGEQNHVHQD